MKMTTGQVAAASQSKPELSAGTERPVSLQEKVAQSPLKRDTDQRNDR